MSAYKVINVAINSIIVLFDVNIPVRMDYHTSTHMLNLNWIVIKLRLRLWDVLKVSQSIFFVPPRLQFYITVTVL